LPPASFDFFYKKVLISTGVINEYDFFVKKTTPQKSWTQLGGRFPITRAQVQNLKGY